MTMGPSYSSSAPPRTMPMCFVGVGPEARQAVPVGIEQGIGRVHGKAGKPDRFFRVLDHMEPVLVPEGLAHPAGDGRHRVDRPRPYLVDDGLADLSELDRLFREVRILLVYADDAPHHRARIGRHDEIGGGQEEEVERVGIDDLPHVHQLPHLPRRGRDLHAQKVVARLGRGKMMAHRTDAADPRRDDGHVPDHPAFAELLESPELRHVEMGVFHVSVLVKVDGDLAVTLRAW